MPKPVTDTIPNSQVKPDPVLEKRTRRPFSAEYKLRIVQEANACQHGELGALLRREKLYHNQIQQWRREFDQGGVESLSQTAPGPRPKFTLEQRKIAELEKKIKRLEHQLQLKDDCLALQKKPCRCSGQCFWGHSFYATVDEIFFIGLSSYGEGSIGGDQGAAAEGQRNRFGVWSS